ncbi:uncharacterized protein LOC133299753 [Gastrolobium bilobum]|uniref:uncharacterized protein LOC133299753 n=1 Tax=Gastrolobium bilobum TaxID=150636 RepID=UPI002AB0CA7B|nr:uncharacterized protein LOC133299753 [Gastrolobium bilobum]
MSFSECYNSSSCKDEGFQRLGNVSADCIRGLSQLSTQSTYSFENDFLKNTERKCITDIKISTEVMTCIAYGTIKAIESKYNWWYKSCKKCPYSVFEDYEKWFCKNCQKHWSDYQPRFSVQVRVVDNTDSASFILFDRDCVTLLGMSASDLRELQYKRGADLEHYPKEFDVLIDKSMLFKINVRKNNFDSYNEPKYQVSKVCTDETIMSSFIKSATELNDETLFDQAFDNDIVAAENGRAADVASQTCESADPVNDSLSMILCIIFFTFFNTNYCRLFCLKLTDVCTIEFQKRGLPHLIFYCSCIPLTSQKMLSILTN